MSDYSALTLLLEQIKHDLTAQVENLEDPTFGDLLGSKNVALSVDNAKTLIAALQQAENAITILSMDSLQLDIQDERMNMIRSDFSELHSAHTLLSTKKCSDSLYDDLKNVVSIKIDKIKANL